MLICREISASLPLGQFERPRQARAVVLRAGSMILEQMPRIDADGEQRIALQVRALAVGVRRHAHVTYQHKRKTIKTRFPYGSVWRQSFPHNFAATRRLVQRTVEGLSKNKCFPTGLGLAHARLAAFCE